MHAAALAQSLDIPRVLVPPHAGVLSALGMLIAPPTVEASQTIVHLRQQLDDARLHSEFGALSVRTARMLPIEQTAKIEAFADCRWNGQSYEVMVPVTQPSIERIETNFRGMYTALYGRCPEGRSMEIVTVRLRRIGRSAAITLPPLAAETSAEVFTKLILPDGREAEVPVIDRAGVKAAGRVVGPALLVDPDATTFVPAGWAARCSNVGSVVVDRGE